MEELLSHEISQSKLEQLRNMVEEMLGEVDSQLHIGDEVDLRIVAADIDYLLNG
ncbi:hypothetical protein D3C76_1771540 [compost metagenome]